MLKSREADCQTGNSCERVGHSESKSNWFDRSTVQLAIGHAEKRNGKFERHCKCTQESRSWIADAGENGRIPTNANYSDDPK